MRKLFKNHNVAPVIQFLKPAFLAASILVVLYYSGFLNGLPSTEDDSAVEKSFDYDFSLTSTNGEKVDMNVYKGKVIFLNMWATWCGPCRKEMPSIQELYNKVDKEKVVFVMLSLDTEENQHKVVKYIKDKGFTFPAFQPAGYLPKQLQVSTIPTTFIIGSDGKVKLKKVGTEDYNTAEFQEFLSKLSTPPAQ